ncbi:MAG TPA: phytanoyl-CoA dioxygenase family protein [Candidatus Binatia bacterium]|jgi:hypothetical protein
MEFRLQELDQTQLEIMAQQYEEEGYFLLSGLEEVITARLKSVLADKLEVDDHQMDTILDPANPLVLSPELQQRLARIQTPPQLASSLLDTLEAILKRLIGPLVHVSSTFHGQWKGSNTNESYQGGYSGNSKEVSALYLLHQDFTGANIPTSPSALTLWAGVNFCPDWTLRIYPGSHRLGLLCNRWMALDDRRLALLGDPIEVSARPGTALLFNALLLHGTSKPGRLQRVSCDIRFFPLCGFLPSEVHFLPSAGDTLRNGLDYVSTSVLRAPLLEDQVFLGEPVYLGEVPRHSVLNWVNYVAKVVRGDMDEALPHLARFMNAEINTDALSAYAAKFHGKPICEATLRSVRDRLAQRC